MIWRVSFFVTFDEIVPCTMCHTPHLHVHSSKKSKHHLVYLLHKLLYLKDTLLILLLLTPFNIVLSTSSDLFSQHYCHGSVDVLLQLSWNVASLISHTFSKLHRRFWDDQNLADRIWVPSEKRTSNLLHPARSQIRDLFGRLCQRQRTTCFFSESNDAVLTDTHSR